MLLRKSTYIQNKNLTIYNYILKVQNIKFRYFETTIHTQCFYTSFFSRGNPRSYPTSNYIYNFGIFIEQ